MPHSRHSCVIGAMCCVLSKSGRVRDLSVGKQRPALNHRVIVTSASRPPLEASTLPKDCGATAPFCGNSWCLATSNTSPRSSRHWRTLGTIYREAQIVHCHFDASFLRTIRDATQQCGHEIDVLAKRMCDFDQIHDCS
jgi:hypothetical protein